MIGRGKVEYGILVETDKNFKSEIEEVK